jgi:enoyl-CoA hydratase/carnithine racemase
MINFNVDNEGIATLEWDLPGRSQNVLNEQSMAAFAAAAQKALADPAVKGLLVASAKADFIAGGDLDMLLKATDAQAMSDNLRQWHKLFRTLETTGKPVAAALNGTTLGGGLELALACHYRVAADNPKARFGFPEVTLGLLPGAGGTQRAPRLMGIQAALLFLTEGKHIKAAEAQKQGLIHAVVPAGTEREAARAWLLEQAAKNAVPGRDGKPGKTLQPWDQKGFKDSRRRRHDPFRHADLHGRQRHAAREDPRQLPGAEAHPLLRLRGDADRHRHRTGHRDALLRQPSAQPGGEEHDPQPVLLHAGRQQADAPAEGRADAEVHEDRHARRRHDGRRHRPRRGDGRPRGGAARQLARERREGQGLLRETAGEARRQKSALAGRRRGHPGAHPSHRPTTPTSPAASWWSRRSSRTAR